MRVLNSVTHVRVRRSDKEISLLMLHVERGRLIQSVRRPINDLESAFLLFRNHTVLERLHYFKRLLLIF